MSIMSVKENKMQSIPPQAQADTTSTLQGNTDLRARIELLESTVLNQARSAETLQNQVSGDNSVSNQQHLHPRSENVPAANDHQQRDRELRLLQNIGTREDSLVRDSYLSLFHSLLSHTHYVNNGQLPRLSNGLTFKLKSTGEILERQPQPVSASDDNGMNGTLVTFPFYKMAALLLENYESNVDHLCCILNIPTVRSLMKTFYLRLHQNESVLPGQAALLLSLFTLAAYFYQPFDGSEVATTKRDVIHLSKILGKGALDLLDYTRRNTSGTMEDVQATILMSYVSYHLDGFSARGRLLSTAAASLARELQLHRLDADNESISVDKQTSARYLMDREIKRRVFWHIASTDWLLSTVSGPQEGTYFIHPNHVDVKVPKDCTDDDLVLGEENQGSHPTSMTYFLERLRLAHLSREMADRVPLDTHKLMHMPYEQVIALDKMLQDYLESLPFFFKLDAESRRRSKPLEIIYHKIPVSRYCTSIEAHSRRFKLHQRFLLRQSVDPRYVYSRRACLESARAVIHAYEDLQEHDYPSTKPEFMGIAMHFTHLALVVMIMDLCFNREQADEEEIKAEVKTALKMFEDTSNPSPLPGRFLSSLSDVLLKHEVHLTDPTSNNVTVAGFAEEMILDTPNTCNPLDEDQIQFPQLGLDMQDPSVTLDASASFDEFWQNAMQSEHDLDSHAWDDLFSGLDSRHI
ncbi:uncharacterized protein PAC_18178 [Phialocephala subalpina]|uniref:Xylanolytic transcriptional activator regulatory domain-containing protein n=1 Tax=Phialocephala subalpina TaxID=576137 RepID=A0A1L7XTD3_9HELO|nr:uncharacterized protein PAC_18178 [Phialocephala subalpina]